MSQAKHLITTHTSGDWKTSLSYRPVFEIPEHTHWAGDAYRNDRIHMVDQMREQAKNMNFPKPVLITEYGGASQGGAGGKILADVHAGQWSSFFLRQAGSPFLWWHDFVHIYDYYRHYRGFAEFIAGVDLRELPFHSEPKVKFFRPGRAVKPKLDREANADLGQVLEARNHFLPFRRESRFLLLDPALYRYESLAVGNRERIYGWIFNREAMFVYPEDPAAYPVADGLAVDLPHDLEPGRYRVRFFDPVGGEAVFDATIRHAGGMLRLPVFPFRLDIAYKLEKTE